MMNIIDFVKEFEFKKRRRLRSWGGGGENMLRGVRPDRGAPPETATGYKNIERKIIQRKIIL